MLARTIRVGVTSIRVNSVPRKRIPSGSEIWVVKLLYICSSLLRRNFFTTTKDLEVQKNNAKNNNVNIINPVPKIIVLYKVRFNNTFSVVTKISKCLVFIDY